MLLRVVFQPEAIRYARRLVLQLTTKRTKHQMLLTVQTPIRRIQLVIRTR